jgi:hypothetical protein
MTTKAPFLHELRIRRTVKQSRTALWISMALALLSACLSAPPRPVARVEVGEPERVVWVNRNSSRTFAADSAECARSAALLVNDSSGRVREYAACLETRFYWHQYVDHPVDTSVCRAVDVRVLDSAAIGSDSIGARQLEQLFTEAISREYVPSVADRTTKTTFVLQIDSAVHDWQNRRVGEDLLTRYDSWAQSALSSALYDIRVRTRESIPLPNRVSRINLGIVFDAKCARYYRPPYRFDR